MSHSQHPLKITYFADFTCPFCYVTEAALLRIGAAPTLDLSPRAYELYPSPTPLPDPAEEAASLDAVRPLAEEVEVVLRLPAVRPRTRKAHEAAAFAAQHGAGSELRRAIYRGFWEDSADIGRIDLLVELGEEVGLDPTALKIALDIDLEGDRVLADLDLARRLRIAGVPTLYVGEGPGARVIQGAQSVRALDEAIRDR